MATEMFIQHLAETTQVVVRAEKKPRRNIQYRDVSSAVAKTDNLEFLTDVVPKTITMKEHKKREEAKRKAKEVADKEREKQKEKAKAQGKNGEAAGATEGALKNGDVREAFKVKTNGHTQENEAATKAPAGESEEVEAMEVDQAEEPQEGASRTQVEDSEPEEDGAAMQIEMEMRGPRTNTSPAATRRSSGFTAINNGA